MGAYALARTAAYSVKSTASSKVFSLVVSRGSVVDFSYPKNPNKAAIVNAANEACLGGGGVDGAISSAGGPSLLDDRYALPVTDGVRCPTGEAKLTGPGSYGSLKVPYVIHAVGPNYMSFDSHLEDGDKLLSSAYTESLERAKDAKLEAVAFSLLSSGIFRGKRSKSDVLKIGVEAIRNFGAHRELEEVHVCAFSPEDADTLMKIASDIGLPRLPETQEL